ncbi:MAG: DNA N-glycosylase and apurinic/apyrimidinic (AP) lyase [Candelina mexicana]|nr:MAG: DNA N-glycosylase and apurinic/apyrimidinic (AP) lyase [Candelina mexicana]
MRTSRIANEAYKITKIISPSQSAAASPQHTSTFARTLGKYTNDPSVRTDAARQGGLKQQVGSESDSELSSAVPSISEDTKDPVQKADGVTSRKRKRGTETTSTSVTSEELIDLRSAGKKSLAVVDAGAPTKSIRARMQPTKKVVSADRGVEIHAPPQWREAYDAVKEMRAKTMAPVDTMGCETLADEHASPRDKRFQTLIALMLSSQTKDTTNAIAMRNLKTQLPAPGLTLENILTVDPEKLDSLIYVVGFHNNKTRFIKATAIILRDDFNSDIPDTIEGLMSLPGVGPKMAYLCMAAAWSRIEGIGVDVHVHRITNYWRWHKTKAPEETRAALESWLPRDKWHEINHLLVGFGQTICLPVGRKCGECTLSEKGLCPAAVVGQAKVEKTRKVKKESLVKEIAGEVKRKVVEVKNIDIKEEDVTVDDVEDFGAPPRRILRSRVR